MTKNISEEELLLRKRARRRLVGAIVLVIVAVIILPAVFDEPKPDAGKQEIAINIPSRNVSSAGSSAEKLPGNKLQDEINPAELLSEPSSLFQDNDQDMGNSAVTQRGIPIPGIKPKIESTQVKSESRIEKNATVAMISKGFVVQLGAFSDPFKAQQQRASLASNGIEAYTEIIRVGNTEVTRVRIGPFSTRVAAEDEVRKLKKLGLDGVVTPK
jgi:DedD protein